MSEVIERNCCVCGDVMDVDISEDGTYSDGNYFGIVKIPVGDGEWVQEEAEDPMSDGAEITVSRWTGEVRLIEYWECDTCFDEDEVSIPKDFDGNIGDWHTGSEEKEE